jgi:hypothetical protein
VKRAVAVVAVTALTVGLAAGSAAATPKVITRKTLAPGVVYQQITDTAVPYRVYAVEFDPTTPATLDSVLSGSQIGTFTRTSTMGANAGALASINGDLNDWPGRPTHQSVTDGRVAQTGSRPGISLGFRRDEHGGTIGHHPLNITAKDLQTKGSASITSWNTDPPGVDEVVGYSRYGGRYAKPGSNQCSARLTTPTPMRWGSQQMGVSRDYAVESVRCGSTAMEVRRGTVVLTARLTGTGATYIKTLKVGHTVRVEWGNGQPGAMDVVSGNALILQNGVIQYPVGCTQDVCDRNPRTAIGITATNHVILLVVDGRSPGSTGMTLYQLGKEMKTLGAASAMNLDGGGSATMWIKGLGVVNHPTDSSGERPVSNAIVILPGADAGEPSPLAARMRI